MIEMTLKIPKHKTLTKTLALKTLTKANFKKCNFSPKNETLVIVESLEISHRVMVYIIIVENITKYK